MSNISVQIYENAIFSVYYCYIDKGLPVYHTLNARFVFSYLRDQEDQTNYDIQQSSYSQN